MDTPRTLRSAARKHDDVSITRRDVDGSKELTIDFGRGVEVTLDGVGDTAILVADGEQYGFEIPREATEITVNDGILSIRE